MSSEGPIAELPCAPLAMADSACNLFAQIVALQPGSSKRISDSKGGTPTHAHAPLGRMSDRLPGNSGPSLGREYAEPVGRPHPGDGAKQQPSCGQFPGRPRPGNGTKQVRSGGESAGEPKACEAQVGNPNWVPSWRLAFGVEGAFIRLTLCRGSVARREALSDQRARRRI